MQSKERTSEEAWPPIKPGTKVRTTQPTPEDSGWTEGARAGCKWGVTGYVITHHDAHGLCYHVGHEDGSVGYYDPEELEIVDTVVTEGRTTTHA